MENKEKKMNQKMKTKKINFSTRRTTNAKVGTRKKNQICTPDIPRRSSDSCDSGKLCGVQIGTVEVLFYNDHIFLCLGQKVTN